MDIGSGTRVIVTGASRGIGRGVATAFAERGCEVGLVARSEEALEELALTLPGEGHEALPADVGDAQAVARAFEGFGRCDVVVANAGIAHYGPFRGLDAGLAERMTRINWLGTVNTVGAALPGMLERARGHVVIVSSGAGLRSFPSAAIYGATKSAQKGFAEALRHELAGTGVSLTTVFPGEVESNLHDHERDRMPDWYRGKDKVAKPEPLARAIVDAVERDRRAVYYPPIIRLLRIANGVSPQLGDRLLRVLRGKSAAPRVD